MSHIQHIGCQPQKTTLHGSKSSSCSAEQGNRTKEKVWQHTPPHPPHCSFEEKDRLAIAIRSLKDRSVTIVSLTQVLVSCVVGVWLVELPSSSIMYWKVPRLIVRKTNRLTRAVVFFRRHFLCGALLCSCSPAEREVYLHMYNGNVSRTLHAQHSVTTNLNISPRFSPTTFLSRCKFSTY